VTAAADKVTLSCPPSQVIPIRSWPSSRPTCALAIPTARRTHLPRTERPPRRGGVSVSGTPVPMGAY